MSITSEKAPARQPRSGSPRAGGRWPRDRSRHYVARRSTTRIRTTSGGSSKMVSRQSAPSCASAQTGWRTSPTRRTTARRTPSFHRWRRRTPVRPAPPRPDQWRKRCGRSSNGAERYDRSSAYGRSVSGTAQPVVDGKRSGTSLSRGRPRLGVCAARSIGDVGADDLADHHVSSRSAHYRDSPEGRQSDREAGIRFRLT